MITQAFSRSKNQESKQEIFDADNNYIRNNHANDRMTSPETFDVLRL